MTIATEGGLMVNSRLALQTSLISIPFPDSFMAFARALGHLQIATLTYFGHPS